MKKQTYVSKIETEDGRMLDFERWSYKRVSTVEKKAKEFFDVMMKYSFFKKQVKYATKITIYDNNDEPVSVITL